MIVIERDGMHYYRRRGKLEQRVPYALEQQQVFLSSARWKFNMTRVVGPKGEESPEIPDDGSFPTLRRLVLESGEPVYIIEPPSE
jgi:hypothetical protein